MQKGYGNKKLVNNIRTIKNSYQYHYSAIMEWNADVHKKDKITPTLISYIHSIII